MTTFKRPVYFSDKVDNIILTLFDIVSTDKLSSYLQVSEKAIVQRKKHLDKIRFSPSKDVDLNKKYLDNLYGQSSAKSKSANNSKPVVRAEKCSSNS